MLNKISVNEPDFQISLLTTHTLLGNSTEITILFSFSGTVDQSVPVPPMQMLHSSAIKTFLHHLTVNAEHLCISAISDVILDDRSLGSPEVSVTLSCSADPRPSPCVHVLSIHLAYNWLSLRQQSSGRYVRPFCKYETHGSQRSLHLLAPNFLPLQPALNKLVHKLFSVHIVGRYPWLFGPLRTKLHLELQWFPSLVRSLLAITARSENLSFRSETQELLKRIHNKASIYKRVAGNTHRSLSLQRAPRSCPSDSLAVEASDEDTLVLALELVLKIAARSPPFKGARCHAASKRSSSDDEETLDFSGPVFCRPSQNFSGDSLSWDDYVPPEVRLSGHWTPGQDITIGDDAPYSTLQIHSSEDSGVIISEKSLTSRSNCDSGVYGEDKNQFTSTSVSPLLAPEWCTRMVLSCLFVWPLASTHHYS
ncbi:hypothetical protein BJY52DRAFT_1244134 [Lactarius psammicola]|nr:hypothetical protein BJY52DRAFT_1244134 [Lactarius psammicola]